MPDLTKLILHSSYPAFKNKREYVGSFVLSGTVVGGVNVRTHVVTLDSPLTDITDVTFAGRAQVGMDGGFGLTDYSFDPRPSGYWFRDGVVWVRGDGTGFTNYPMPFTINYAIAGNQLTITAICVQQFGTPLTLTAESVSYKIVDYINT